MDSSGSKLAPLTTPLSATSSPPAIPAMAALAANAESLVRTTLRPRAATARSLRRTENHQRPSRARRSTATTAATRPSTAATSRKNPASLPAKAGGCTRLPSSRPGKPSAKITRETAALNTSVNTARFRPRRRKAGIPTPMPTASATSAAIGNWARNGRSERWLSQPTVQAPMPAKVIWHSDSSPALS